MTILLLLALILILYLLGAALFIAETQDDMNLNERSRRQLAAMWPLLAALWLGAQVFNRKG